MHQWWKLLYQLLCSGNRNILFFLLETPIISPGYFMEIMLHKIFYLSLVIYPNLPLGNTLVCIIYCDNEKNRTTLLLTYETNSGEIMHQNNLLNYNNKFVILSNLVLLPFQFSQCVLSNIFFFFLFSIIEKVHQHGLSNTKFI